MAKTKTVNISNSVIHLLHRASQFADHQFEQNAAGSGLTARQIVVLDAIAMLNEPSQTDVCEVTGIDRSTLADMVRRLCAKRLIARRRSRADARAYNLKLTGDGVACLAKLLPEMEAAEELVTAELSESRRRDFMDLLHAILAQSSASVSKALAAPRKS